MGEPIERFPLFPLGLVLLPGEVVPLHIFEDRYKVMIELCLDSELEFGILFASDDDLAEIGCAASVTQLVERMEDGRMNILVQGTRPFRLDRRVDDLAYPAGDVELLDDAPAGSDPGAPEAARHAYADLVEQVTDTRPSEADLAELDAYGMASTIAFDPEDKQTLLELRAEDDRLRRLAELCATALETYETSRVAAERARTNGRAHT
jgi:Lon protease-like protein